MSRNARLTLVLCAALVPLTILVVVLINVTYEVMGPWLEDRSAVQRAAAGLFIGALLASPGVLLLSSIRRNAKFGVLAYWTEAFAYLIVGGKPAGYRASFEAQEANARFLEQADWYIITSIVGFCAVVVLVAWLLFKRLPTPSKNEPPETVSPTD